MIRWLLSLFRRRRDHKPRAVWLALKAPNTNALLVIDKDTHRSEMRISDHEAMRRFVRSVPCVLCGDDRTRHLCASQDGCTGYRRPAPMPLPGPGEKQSR